MIQYCRCSQLENDKRFVEIIKVIFEISEWLLGISSDGDDRRIFFGFEIFDSGIFWVRKFGLGSLI